MERKEASSNEDKEEVFDFAESPTKHMEESGRLQVESSGPIIEQRIRFLLNNHDKQKKRKYKNKKLSQEKTPTT